MAIINPNTIKYFKDNKGCTFQALFYCEHPSTLIYLCVMIALNLPFYFYSAMMMRRLKFQIRNHFMPGLFYSFATGIYNVWYWYDSYVFYYFYHYLDEDFYYQIRGIWDNITKLASIMLFHQIASFLIAFNIKIAKFLKYFNYIFFLLYLVRLLGCIVYAFDRDFKFGRDSSFFKGYGLVYELLYGFQYIYSLVLLNVCFALSNIKDYIPKKFHIPNFVSIFTITIGLFVCAELDAIYDSIIVFRYQFNDLNKLNNIKLIIQLAVNFVVDIPVFVIIWILSITDYDDDATNSSLVLQADLVV